LKKEIFLLTILGLFIFSGCATDSYRSGSDDYYDNDPGMSVAQRFADLPVPAGFILNRKESFIFQNNRTRMGTMTYVGSGDVTQIIEFYKKTMPKHNWSLLTTVEFNRAVMSFEKEAESCIVTIEKRGMKKLYLTLALSPLSKGAVKIEEVKQK
jgi:hypothetical protein